MMPTKEFLEEVRQWVETKPILCVYNYSITNAGVNYHTIVIDGKKHLFQTEESVTTFIKTVNTNI
jgi:hypothetical protein